MCPEAGRLRVGNGPKRQESGSSRSRECKGEVPGVSILSKRRRLGVWAGLGVDAMLRGDTRASTSPQPRFAEGWERVLGDVYGGGPQSQRGSAPVFCVAPFFRFASRRRPVLRPGASRD